MTVSKDEKRQTVFLLGGHDLEMLEIRNLLIKLHIPFFDRNLHWGTKLSSYQDILNDKDHFFSVELIEDILLPKHFTRIDHHNELSKNPSSLEQVATILGIELDRHQILIAANDRGYIPEMIINQKVFFGEGVNGFFGNPYNSLISLGLINLKNESAASI
jgi:hypothetical protein